MPIATAVSIRARAERSESSAADLQSLSTAVYPPDEAEAWPGRHIEWAGSDWDVCVTRDNRLVSYVGAIERDGLHDSKPVSIGGIGRVKTHPETRRKGMAALGIARAIDFFGERGLEFGLLVCDPSLLGYYTQLGWREFGGTLLTKQHDNTVEFTFNRVMVIDVNAQAPNDGVIDLLGPPW